MHWSIFCTKLDILQTVFTETELKVKEKRHFEISAVASRRFSLQQLYVVSQFTLDFFILFCGWLLIFHDWGDFAVIFTYCKVDILLKNLGVSIFLSENTVT